MWIIRSMRELYLLLLLPTAEPCFDGDSIYYFAWFLICLLFWHLDLEYGMQLWTWWLGDTSAVVFVQFFNFLIFCGFSPLFSDLFISLLFFWQPFFLQIPNVESPISCYPVSEMHFVSFVQELYGLRCFLLYCFCFNFFFHYLRFVCHWVNFFKALFLSILH